MNRIFTKFSLLIVLGVGCSTSKTRIWIDPPLGLSSEVQEDKNVSYRVEDVSSGKTENIVIPMVQSPENITIQDERKKALPSDPQEGELVTQADQQIHDGTLAEHSSEEKPKISYLMGISKVEELYKKKKYAEALVRLAPLVKQYPKQTKLFVMQGTLFKKMGDSKLALEAYKRAQNLEPNNRSIRESISRLEVTL